MVKPGNRTVNFHRANLSRFSADAESSKSTKYEPQGLGGLDDAETPALNDPALRIDCALDQLNIRHFLGNPTALNQAIAKSTAMLIQNPEFSKTAIRLYFVLVGKMNRKTGYCYPGVDTLANELSVSPQAVRKACRELQSAGFIHVEQNASIFRTNVFVLDFRMLLSIDYEGKNMTTFGKPETLVSGPLSIEIFGETTVSGLGFNEQELLNFASERKFSHG